MRCVGTARMSEHSEQWDKGDPRVACLYSVRSSVKGENFKVFVQHSVWKRDQISC